MPVIERIERKLSSWKSKTLSFGGRVTFTKAFLGSLPLFYFLLFRASNFVIDFLERCQRRFLWGSNEEKSWIHWVACKFVLVPKDKGWMGIGSMISLNWVLLFKWIWQFKMNPDSLWRKVICETHNLSRKPVSNLSKKICPMCLAKHHNDDHHPWKHQYKPPFGYDAPNWVW